MIATRPAAERRAVSPAALAFERILAPGAEVDAILARLADAARLLTPDDAIALGFWRAAGLRSGTREMGAANGLGYGQLTLAFTPGAARVCLAWRPDAGAWMRFWVDGIELPVPRDPNGRSLALEPAHWCDERFYLVTIALPNHPLQDWSGLASTGSQYGLLVWDAQRRVAHRAEPGPTERWPAPWLEVVDAHRLRVHPDEDEPAAGAVRTIVV